MSGSKNKQQKQSADSSCQSSDLLAMMKEQMVLMTELVKQNNELVTQAEAREQFLLEIIEQNNELLSEREEEDSKPQSLDMDDE